MRKHVSFLPLFFALVLLIGCLQITPASATSYYNHVDNPGFDQYFNYVEDNGFESGLFNQGLYYTNMTNATGSVAINSVQVYEGQYSCYLPLNNGIWLNVTDESLWTIGADVVEFSIWSYGATDNPIDLRVYHSDDSYTSINDKDYGSASTWQKFDYTPFLETDEDIVAFYISSDTTSYIDNLVYTLDTGTIQDDITHETHPWYHLGTAPLTDFSDYGYIEILDTFGYTQNSCLQTGNLDSRCTVVQDTDLVDTDYIYYCDLYYYAVDCSDMDLEFIVYYSDGSTDTKTKSLAVNGTWTYLNFGVSWIDADKYISMIGFRLTEYNWDTLYIDEVGLWSSIPVGSSDFEFTISPYPIWIESTWFSARMNVQYVMTCYLYNSTGGLSDSGNYTIIDNMGTDSGTFTDGVFTHTITPRQYTTDSTEHFIITIITDDGYVYTFDIRALWDYVGGSSGDGSGDNDGIPVTDVANFVVIFFVLFVPGILLSQAIKPAIIGFISGLCLGVVTGVIVNIVPFYALFVVAIVLVLLILRGRS